MTACYASPVPAAPRTMALALVRTTVDSGAPTAATVRHASHCFAPERNLQLPLRRIALGSAGPCGLLGPSAEAIRVDAQLVHRQRRLDVASVGSNRGSRSHTVTLLHPTHELDHCCTRRFVSGPSDVGISAPVPKTPHTQSLSHSTKRLRALRRGLPISSRSLIRRQGNCVD